MFQILIFSTWTFTTEHSLIWYMLFDDDNCVNSLPQQIVNLYCPVENFLLAPKGALIITFIRPIDPDRPIRFWQRLQEAFRQRVAALPSCNPYALVLVVDRKPQALHFRDRREELLQKAEVIQRDHGKLAATMAGWWFGNNPKGSWENKNVGGLEATIIFYFPIYWVAVIIPIDFHIFQRGGEKPPSRMGCEVTNIMNRDEQSPKKIYLFFHIHVRTKSSSQRLAREFHRQSNSI